MTNRERIVNTLNFKKSDRLPMVEWAAWWDKTVERWQEEGLDKSLSYVDIKECFGIDELKSVWISFIAGGLPPIPTHGQGHIENEEDYEKYRFALYPNDAVKWVEDSLRAIKPGHDRGEYAVWFTLNGYFWFPRVLFGIQNHLFSFYDYPELYHRICEDICEFQLKVIDEFCGILVPDFMTFAEDMSFNNGPMLSEDLYNEFIKPYYIRVITKLKSYGIKVFVDTDGNVMPMIPWLIDSGVEGILPLERQAGVDVAEIRRLYPNLLMLGGYDKMVMKQGEAAIRAEFERLLPVMKTGGYIPSVDHQTPPDVSLENYKIYSTLFEEYMLKAME
ncbi:MAG: uroporphyrinogen decarboxylase family protein [Bacillota bacterium]